MRAREQAAFRKTFGKSVRAARRSLRLSQRELAERADLSEKYLSRVELGVATPSIVSAHQIARALGLSLDELVGKQGGGTATGTKAATDPRVSAVLGALRDRGSVHLERAVRVLEALIDEA